MLFCRWWVEQRVTESQAPDLRHLLCGSLLCLPFLRKYILENEICKILGQGHVVSYVCNILLKTSKLSELKIRLFFKFKL